MSLQPHTIWKFPLTLTECQQVLMPEGAKIMTAQIQAGDLYLWARVNPAAARRGRVIRIIGTGHAIENDDCLHYIASVQANGGALVWHIFEELAS
jgi:hypothetical protein